MRRRPEHVRAKDLRHFRHALSEIRRPNCPQDVKKEQRRRLEMLKEIHPGIIDEESKRSTAPDDS